MVYVNTCKLCRASGTCRRYIGETARSGYRRSVEHLEDAINKKEDSHIHSHIEDSHKDLGLNLTSAQEVSEVFEFKLIQKHPSSLQRQVTEAVKIRLAGNTAINSKEEYNRCTIPALEVSHPKPSTPEPPQTPEDQETLLEHLTLKNKRPRTRSQAKIILNGPSKPQNLRLSPANNTQVGTNNIPNKKPRHDRIQKSPHRALGTTPMKRPRPREISNTSSPAKISRLETPQQQQQGENLLEQQQQHQQQLRPRTTQTTEPKPSTTKITHKKTETKTKEEKPEKKTDRNTSSQGKPTTTATTAKATKQQQQKQNPKHRLKKQQQQQIKGQPSISSFLIQNKTKPQEPGSQ